MGRACMFLAPESIEYALLGGALLGGGGGGWPDEGRKWAQAAFAGPAKPTLISLDELPPEALVATVSLVGSPAAKERYCEPGDAVAAVELLAQRLGSRPAALITSENGGAATVNGWFQSAAMGIPLVDAAANGRAHPLGIMGAMGLDLLPDYRSLQCAVGGNPRTGQRIALSVEGSVSSASDMVLHAAQLSGGMVAVARNPVPASYLKENAAVGVISMALELGKLIHTTRAQGGRAVAEELARVLGGKIIVEGEVSQYWLARRAGLDLGCVVIGDYELVFWNEYLTLERNGRRLATFPDLIATLDAASGQPVVSAAVCRGMKLICLKADKAVLPLGAGMRIEAHFRRLEEVTGKEILPYVFGQRVESDAKASG